MKKNEEITKSANNHAVVIFYNTVLTQSFAVNLHKKRSLPLNISSVNVTKSVGNCGFGHIYYRNPEWKTSFSVECILQKTFLKISQNSEKNTCARISFISDISFKSTESLFPILHISRFVFHKFGIFAIVCQL